MKWTNEEVEIIKNMMIEMNYLDYYLIEIGIV